MGHSIGCHMILKVLDEINLYPQGPSPHTEGASIILDKSYLLFPVIERLTETPNGKFLQSWHFLIYILFFISRILSFLPRFVRQKIVRFYLLYFYVCNPKEELVESVIDAILIQISPVIFRNMFDLVFDELSILTSLDKECILRHKDRLVFYYGTTDAWCPVHFYDELLSRCPGVSAYVCKNSLEHGFMLRQGKITAEVCAKIIMKEENRVSNETFVSG